RPQNGRPKRPPVGGRRRPELAPVGLSPPEPSGPAASMWAPRRPRRLRSTRSGLVPAPRLSSGEPMSPRRQSPYVVGIEDALAELRAGRMVILMDDEDRENEGDLCVAAERVTAEPTNFMATHRRRPLCLSRADG